MLAFSHGYTSRWRPFFSFSLYIILNFDSITSLSLSPFVYVSLSRMEATQEYCYSSYMTDSRNMINKGKRTKRPRPSSPLALTMASTSSTTTSEDGDTENPTNSTFHMPTNTSIEFTKILQEHEEEDMANCLILLAQGQSSLPPPLHNESAVEVARKSQFYLYECKTCYRGFSSFQALGGHRASHKKPFKPNVEDKSRLSMAKQDVDVDLSSTTLSLQIGSNQVTPCNPSGSVKVTKIHICSICGAEFGSGQALGGHMRRHRSMSMATTNCSGSNGCQESKKPKSVLSLDLNLPAPIEDDQREKKFPFRSRDQMITFSNSSLVHCHF
ncbi:putative transcription factor C2H2 family [Helianthus annuus]|uniref:Putative C2H2-type zinc finger family protein n=2 Tax=Helianthus annuus TaxID=4232 RepID=A0A251VT07_HELAN|nr:putative transcription factor C2H2 family [Helianthus annuus]KAJ0628362.1 putative transcription factor C2H2 family [Helianthus annuus]KAJ0949715.1 putative transcription factor C2H2 family [Helianthus annuus]KAJ0958491.1 putative transcription factor C2H2 family [Helianthus annuus]